MQKGGRDGRMAVKGVISVSDCMPSDADSISYKLCDHGQIASISFAKRGIAIINA